MRYLTIALAKGRLAKMPLKFLKILELPARK